LQKKNKKKNKAKTH